MPYQEECNIIVRNLEKERWNTWNLYKDYRGSKGLLGNHIHKWAEEVINMKKQACTIMDLFSGHCELRYYTKRRGIVTCVGGATRKKNSILLLM